MGASRRWVRARSGIFFPTKGGRLRNDMNCSGGVVNYEFVKEFGSYAPGMLLLVVVGYIFSRAWADLNAFHIKFTICFVWGI